MRSRSSPASPYCLDQLGWFQFEQLCSLVFEVDADTGGLPWLGRADSGRVAPVQESVVLAGGSIRLEGPFTAVVMWVADDRPLAERLSGFAQRLAALPDDVGLSFEARLLVLTNLDGRAARWMLEKQRALAAKRVVVLGSSELGKVLDCNAELRAAMPSVLGLRDLTPLIDAGALKRSSLDVEAAQGLARVFLPTRAYERARRVLARHRFVVLTGPPEMGKTAIAQMLALARLTDGWEAHECNSPEQVWRVFDRERRQVFVADDAFGSTEYRPDAAERWARELGRLLRVLDGRHWLIWTSRPAPLKAGLRRVQRERGSERFPAPGEVLVDASDLDLAEKTLILFRHAKNRTASNMARQLVRSVGLSIVEHPHFTPERIRRFVTNRLDELPHVVVDHGPVRLLNLVDHELATPTEAMGNSFRALGAEHRELLIALLDAPAGLIDERELAATVRRHHAGGLSRPPGELIDRLTDHFLRVTPLGIGWVHPSWRDLVINELRRDDATRSRFLKACGIQGVTLALSQEGGIAGERTFPLLITDADWDQLGDRVAQLLRDLEDPDIARLLLALAAAIGDSADPAQTREAQCLAEYVLGATKRSWDKEHRVLPLFLLEPWYRLNTRVAEPLDPPQLAATWTELQPMASSLERLDQLELTRIDEWLALAQTLPKYDPTAVAALGGIRRDETLLERLVDTLTRGTNPETRPLAESILTRIQDLAPEHGYSAAKAIAIVHKAASIDEQRWWIPEDIAAPPTTEPATSGPEDFQREDVHRVLNDL